MDRNDLSSDHGGRVERSTQLAGGRLLTDAVVTI
jgi:hypothetical protein